MSCKCQRCGNQFKVDINIPDEIWIKISPKGNEGGLLCAKCIFESLENLGYGAFELIDLV